MPASIRSPASLPEARSTSPASVNTPSAPRSRRPSDHMLPALERSAARMTGGASAAPRKYDEWRSYGSPMIRGPGWDMLDQIAVGQTTGRGEPSLQHYTVRSVNNHLAGPTHSGANSILEPPVL